MRDINWGAVALVLLVILIVIAFVGAIQTSPEF
jgi:hypothetical protein